MYVLVLREVYSKILLLLNGFLRIGVNALLKYIYRRRKALIAKAAARVTTSNEDHEVLASDENREYVNKALDSMNKVEIISSSKLASSNRSYWPPKKARDAPSSSSILYIDMKALHSIADGFVDETCLVEVDNERYDSKIFGSWSLFEADIRGNEALSSRAFKKLGKVTFDPCGTVSCSVAGLRGLDWFSTRDDGLELNIATSASVLFVYRGAVYGNRVVGGRIFRCKDMTSSEQSLAAPAFRSNNSHGLFETTGSFLLIKG